MNPPSTEPGSQTIAVARAVRFGFTAIVLGMSYPNIRLALGLHRFGVIYQDMLGGDQTFPLVTRLILWTQPFLVTLSILIPLAAILTLFVGRLSRSIYITGVLLLVVFLQVFSTWHAVAAPFLEIIRRMQGEPQP